MKKFKQFWKKALLQEQLRGCQKIVYKNTDFRFRTEIMIADVLFSGHPKKGI